MIESTPGYRTWVGMRQRCRNPKSRNYPRYGGRGIKICKRWDSFQTFLDDMGPKPKGLSIDRIDNDGHYEPANCRWATAAEQVRGCRTAAWELAEREGISRKAAWARLHYQSKKNEKDWDI